MHNYIPNSGQSQCPLLKMGSTGASVKKLQYLLGVAGFNPGKIDGIFGPLTREAVINFQNTKKLVRDGIVGNMTWAALGVDCKTPPVTTCPTLTYGSTGSAVATLQSILQRMGFYAGNVDGIFGPLTREAVINFQNTKKLVRDGIVGPRTWAALGVDCNTPPVNTCPTLVYGNTGPEVATLQSLLQTRGFYVGNIDGIFGPLTREAVINFQNTKKLVRDGIVGPRTWAALGVDCS